MSPKFRDSAYAEVKERIGSSGSWRLLFVLTLIFGLVWLIYFSLEFGYKPILNNSISNLDERLEDFSTSPDLREQKNLVSYYSQIVNIETILKSHIFSSKVFEFLEDYTHTRTTYSTLDLSVEQRLLTMEGITQSYDTMVQQIIAYESAPNVAKVDLDENIFTNNVVRFKARITFDPKIFAPETLSATAPLETTETEETTEETIEETTTE